MTTATADRGTETLRIISPCEHGVDHEILSVAEGVTDFCTPLCLNSKGGMRVHKITAEKYPNTERNR